MGELHSFPFFWCIGREGVGNGIWYGLGKRQHDELEVREPVVNVGSHEMQVRVRVRRISDRLGLASVMCSLKSVDVTVLF